MKNYGEVSVRLAGRRIAAACEAMRPIRPWNARLGKTALSPQGPGKPNDPTAE
jgi:hypothetical protein